MQSDTGNKLMVIMGSAPCARTELEMFAFNNSNFDLMLIGLTASDMTTRRAMYIATYHPAEIPLILKKREAAGGNTDYKMISHINSAGVDILVPFVPPTGSSSLLGALAALKFGYEKIVLCGCPLIGENSKKESYEVFRKGWEAKSAEVMGKVKSMSGWTKDFLGYPDPEWLRGAIK